MRRNNFFFLYFGSSQPLFQGIIPSFTAVKPLLVGGYGQMMRRFALHRFALVNGTTRQIQQVSGLQDQLHQRLAWIWQFHWCEGF